MVPRLAAIAASILALYAAGDALRGVDGVVGGAVDGAVAEAVLLRGEHRHLQLHGSECRMSVA